MKIGIDIDDTICNSKELQQIYWDDFQYEYPNKLYSKELPENINQFGDPYIDFFWDIYREDLFAPTIKDNASNVISFLKEKHDVSIITSRSSNNYFNLEGRLREWLEENGISIDTYHLSVKDKGLYMLENNIDLLIDDDIRHIKSALEYGKDVIHFQNISWLDVKDIISVGGYKNDKVKRKVRCKKN